MAEMTPEELHAARLRVKQRLGRYTALKRERAWIEEELYRLDGSPRGGHGDGMPRGSGVSDPTAQVAEERLRLQERYQEQLARLDAEQLAIEELIEPLDPTARALLRHRYIEGLQWERVCVVMAYSWRQIHRLHAEVLDKLVEIGGDVFGRDS